MRRLGRNLRDRHWRQSLLSWLYSPDFYAPLTHSLELIKGTGVATFTRATTGTCLCYAENANSGDNLRLQTIPAGSPRFEGARFIASNNTFSDKFANGTQIPFTTLKGVRLETASTNLFLQSNAFLTSPNVADLTGRGTLVQNAQGIDGQTSAWTVTDTSTGVSMNNYQFMTLTSATYTASVYIKKTNGATVFPFVQFLNTTTAQQMGCVLDTNTGVATSFTTPRAGYTIINSTVYTLQEGDFYRVCLTFTGTASSAWRFYPIIPAATTVSNTTNALPNDTLTGSNIYCNAQVELKPVASSYIPTTTATVSRNADQLVYTNAGNVLDDKGTVLLEATPSFNIPNSAAAGFGGNFLMDFGSNNGKIVIENNILKRSDGLNLLESPTWTPVKGTTYKIGSRYGVGGQRNWLNGVAGTNGSFDGSINSGANMTVGGYGAVTTYNWGGNIKNLKIWKRVLSDLEITRGTS